MLGAVTEVGARAARKASLHSAPDFGAWYYGFHTASLKVYLTRLNERGIKDLFCLMCRLEAAYLGVRLPCVLVGSAGPIHLTF